MRSRHIGLAAAVAGRTFIVTGANSGIGLETARDLVGNGAHVVLAVRDTAKGEQAAGCLRGSGSSSVVNLDLSDLDMVARCADTLLDRHNRLSALICNAGVMGGPLLLTREGFERQMATNHLGHAALVAALWPLLDASASRVVVVSSGEARDGQLSPQTTREQLQLGDPRRLRRRHARLVAVVDVGLADPRADRLDAVAELLGDPLDRAL